MSLASSNGTKMRRRFIAAIVTATVGLLGFAVSAVTSAAQGSTHAQGSAQCTATIVNGPDSNCGPYDYPQITASNGFTTYVGIDGWACGPADRSHPWGNDCGPTRLTATNPGHWNVTTKEAKGNTAVLMYPSLGQLYNNPSLSRMTLIRSSFTESMPHNSGTVGWAAYDIFLNNSGPSNEVMIQLDSVNECLSCSQLLAHVTFGLQRFTLYEYGGPGGELIWHLNHAEHTGTVYVLAMLRWLQRHRYIRRSSTLGIVGFGWEISSTGGVPETFSVSKFWLHTR
jgi:hypothetical protein